MILLDVNVLVRAHRPDFLNAGRTREWLESALVDEESVAVWDVVLTSAFRVLTHPKIVREPNASRLALTFLQQVRDASVVLREGERHWQLVRQLIEDTRATGNLVTDAAIAALCIEHGCRLATFDGDFARFRGLQFFEPKLAEELI